MIGVGMAQKKTWQWNPEKVVFLLALVVGLLMCVFIPYGAGFDEEAHIVRYFDVSGLHFIPNRGIENGDYTLGEFINLSYQRRNFQSPATDLLSGKLFWEKPDWSNMADGTTRSAYFPLLYIPQAVVAGIFWRVFDWPIIPGVIVMRWVGFLMYFGLIYLAHKQLPLGRLLFLIIAFSPMALFQAATLNTDGLTNAVGMLFIAYLVKLIVARDRAIDAKETAVLAVLILLVGCVKPGTFFLLFLLIALWQCHFTAKKYAWWIAGSAVFSTALSVFWAIFAVFFAPIPGSSDTLMSKLIVIYHHLGEFILNFLRGIGLSLGNYFHDLVGVYGYWVGKVPWITYVLFPLAILLAYLYDQREAKFSPRSRVLLLVGGVLSLLSISSYQFIYSFQPGVQTIAANGRYFVAFIPSVFLAFAGWVDWKKNARIVAIWLAVALYIAAVAAYGWGLYQTYYTKCVYPVTAASPCRLPVYKNVDIQHPPLFTVDAEHTVMQSFTPECDQMSAVSLRIQAISAEAGDQAQVQVLDEKQRVLAESTFALSGLGDSKELSIPLDFALPAGQKQLWMRFALVDGDSNHASLEIVGRSGAAIYPQGNLLVNGVEQDADLIFWYTCVHP
jgi:uncharacterized membrane protein